MPDTMEKLRKQFEEFRQRRPQEEQGQEGLVKQKAESCLAKVEDFIPPDPKNIFLKELQDISREVRQKYPNSGPARRFQEELNAFLNDYSFRLRTDPVVPKNFQVDMLNAAAGFDKDGSVIGHLCELFSGNYRTHYRKPGERRERRYCAAAERLRKVARTLLNRARL